MRETRFNILARGKLLLTGEYFVLDGIPALAVPTRPGQSFMVSPAASGKEHDLYWEAMDERGVRWFSHAFDRHEWLKPPQKNEDPHSRVLQLLYVAERLRPGCTQDIRGIWVTTRLQFNRKWGLGSSSTLVAALAQWLQVDPFALLANTFGGSGYDLVCAMADGPILYQRAQPRPRVMRLDWRPDWATQTHFVYLNQKQNSREGIRNFRQKDVSPTAQKSIAEITTALISPTLHPRAVARLIARHERIVSETLDLPTVQERLFADFPGQLKSLGAWGGDFIWAFSEESPEKVRAYFNERGYQTVIPFNDLVL
ncbi:MAG: GYDIA family GHMP kinase [Bacteroidota bacterium]